jgi:hypothetical protein
MEVGVAQNRAEAVAVQFDKNLMKKVEDGDAQEAGAYTYSAGQAKQWVAEDSQFCEENYESDPFFDKMNQAKLRRSIESGKYTERKRIADA